MANHLEEQKCPVSKPHAPRSTSHLCLLLQCVTKCPQSLSFPSCASWWTLITTEGHDCADWEPIPEADGSAIGREGLGLPPGQTRCTETAALGRAGHHFQNQAATMATTEIHSNRAFRRHLLHTPAGTFFCLGAKQNQTLWL